jgi:hypothetical protein
VSLSRHERRKLLDELERLCLVLREEMALLQPMSDRVFQLVEILRESRAEQAKTPTLSRRLPEEGPLREPEQA